MLGNDNLHFLLIMGCLICAFVMPVFARWKREACAPIAIAISGTAFFISMTLARRVLQGEIISYGVGGWPPPWGIEIIVEPLSSLMLLVITGICFLISIYSFRSIPKEIGEGARGWYYVEFVLCMTAMMGLVISNDLFNMYVFIEVVGISACALVVSKGDRMATEATLKYLLLATIGSGFILLGIGFIYMITGHLNVTYAGETLARVGGDYPFLMWAIMSFFVVGFGVKSALFPLHLWLPDAHSSAPSSSSAVLSSLVVKVYIVTLFKILFLVFGTGIFEQTYIRQLILIMATAAMLGGSFFAFVQLEIKRRLAYSTVAQVGYIFLGIGLGTPYGILAAFFHLVVHAFMKTCLFLAAGSIYYQTGFKRVNQLTRLGYKMPVTMLAFVVAAFSMVGIPLTGGFISKYALALGSLEAGYPFFIVLLVISGLLNAMYYFPIIWQAYFEGDPDIAHDSHDQHGGHGGHGHHEEPTPFELDKVPLTMLAPMVVLAIGIFFLGVFTDYIYVFLNLIVDRFI